MLQLEIIETGALISETGYYQMHPNVAFGQPLTNAILDDAYATWPESIVHARIFVPTVARSLAHAMLRIGSWEQENTLIETPFEYDGVSYLASPWLINDLSSWREQPELPEGFTWAGIDGIERPMSSEQLSDFLSAVQSFMSQRDAPIISSAAAMRIWANEQTDFSVLDNFSPESWRE